MSLTHETIQEFAKMLRNLDQWIDKATEHAKAKSFETSVLAEARLAPDQYPFVRQVQASCDTAKFAAALLSGKEAPAHPDTEKTLPELKQRIAAVLGHLETYSASDFEGAEERKVSPRWLAGKWVRGDHYLLQIAVPNFFFHLTTAYAILRHNGVDVGKMDYLGNLPIRD